MGITILIFVLIIALVFTYLYYLLYATDTYSFGTIIHKTRSGYVVQSKINGALIKCYSLNDHKIGEDVSLIRVRFNWYIV